MECQVNIVSSVSLLLHEINFFPWNITSDTFSGVVNLHVYCLMNGACGNFYNDKHAGTYHIWPVRWWWMDGWYKTLHPSTVLSPFFMLRVMSWYYYIHFFSVYMSCSVQSGVSVPEERSITDRGGWAGSRSTEYRCPGCQRRHRHPVNHLNSF